MRISDWSSDVCSSDLCETGEDQGSGEGKEEALLLVTPDQVRGDGGLIKTVAKGNATGKDRGKSRRRRTTPCSSPPRSAPMPSLPRRPTIRPGRRRRRRMTPKDRKSTRLNSSH